MADVDRPLAELRHHEDRSDRLLLGVSNDGHLLGPLLKVLRTEPDSYSLVSCATASAVIVNRCGSGKINTAEK